MNREILKTKSAKFTLSFLAFCFILTSVSGVIFVKGKYDFINVDGEKINIRDFYYSLYNKKQQEYMKNPSEKTNSYINSQIFVLTFLDSLLKDTLIKKDLEDLNIRYSDSQLLKEIVSDKAFKDENTEKFDINKYKYTLQVNKMTDVEYLDSIREQYNTLFMFNTIKNNNLFNDSLLSKLKIIKNQLKVVDLYSINKNKIKVKVATPDNIELKKYYDNNIELFTYNEERKIDFVSFDVAYNFEKEVSEKDIQEYYKNNLSNFKTEKIYQIYDIRSKNKNEIKNIVDNLNKNKKIENLIEKYLTKGKSSLSTETLTADGLDYLYNKDIKNLKVNQISEIMEYKDLKEWGVIFIRNISPEKTKTIDEAKQDIIYKLRLDDNTKNINERIEKINQLLLTEENIQDLATKMNLKAETLDFINVNKIEELKLFANSKELAQYKINQFSKLQEKDGKYFIYSIAEIKPFYVATLEEAKEEIVKIVVNEKKERLYIQQIKNSIENNKLDADFDVKKDFLIKENNDKFSQEFIQEVYSKEFNTFTNIYSDNEKQLLYFAKIKYNKEVKEYEDDFKNIYNLKKKMENEINKEIEDLYVKALKNNKFKVKINYNLLKYIQ